MPSMSESPNETSSEAVFILAKIGAHSSDRMFLRFEGGAPVWTGDRTRAAAFTDEASALALVDRHTGIAYEGGVRFVASPVES